jgi:hypothetical protein
MNEKRQLLILLAAVIITSGCMNGGSETESEGSQAITVEELTVRPSQIYSGSSTTATLHIKNTGELPANLTINSGFDSAVSEQSGDGPSGAPGPGSQQSSGSSGPTGGPGPGQINQNNKQVTQDLQSSGQIGSYGDRILTNRCRDIFDVTDFEVRGPGDISGSSRYYLPERGEVRFNWVLENINTGNVPINGYSCNLKFQVPFDYTVTAYRQLQFKESAEIEGTPNLNSRSSTGPMSFRIETIGSTSQQASTFLEGDQPEIIIYMVNQGQEGTSYTGFINAKVPEIEAAGFSLENSNCDRDIDETITMYRGESERIRCQVDQNVFENLDGSLRGEITAETEYTYVKNLGQKKVQVQYRGN